MQHWGSLIDAAEEPLPLSSRDGKLLRLVPANQRLSRTELKAQLQVALTAHQLAPEARSVLAAAWQRGRAPGRAAVALMRGYAYLQDGQLDLAQRVRSGPLHVADATFSPAGSLYMRQQVALRVMHLMQLPCWQRARLSYDEHLLSEPLTTCRTLCLLSRTGRSGAASLVGHVRMLCTPRCWRQPQIIRWQPSASRGLWMSARECLCGKLRWSVCCAAYLKATPQHYRCSAE